MLTDKQIAEALDLIDGRYHDVITKYLQKVGKTINEIGHLNQSSINLLIQLRRMGVDVQTIERELQKVTKLTKQDIKTLYQKAAQEANTDARFSYVSKGAEPDSIRWEALVEDIWKQTASAMDNLSNTTVITDGYRSAIDDAVQAVTMGASDYNSVIRDTVKRLGKEGLQVEYESTYIAADGQLKHRRRRLDSAVRQNVLDGIRQVQQKAQELIGEEIGADGVDITAHPNSAPDHEPVQGRRFDLENFQRMQSGLDFEDVDGHFYKGFERPITQWRCRHLTFYILLGVTRRMYTDEQLKNWEQDNKKGCTIDGKHYTGYQATQLLRDIETEIRKQKDTAILAKASGDDVLRRECQSNINKLTKKYNAVAEAAGLRKQMQKTRVEGFAPIKEQKETLENSAESVTMDMNRKTRNTGAFAILPERMSKKHIREVAKECGLDLRGIILHVDANEDLLRIQFTGRADPENIGGITFFPNAFISREELVRTLFHEMQHVSQFREFGVEYVQENRAYFEHLAYKAEAIFIKTLKEKGVI